MNKYISTLLIATTLTLSVFVYVLWQNRNNKSNLGDGVTRYLNIATTASSTVFTVTTTSQQLLATTTSPNNRVAALIQLAGCTVAGTRLHLNRNNDIPATTGTGPVINASSTESIAFGVYGNPVSNNAVQGITNASTCTVVVTEWQALR